MDGAFDASEMKIFEKVVEEACRKLGCDETLKAMVAARVLSFAATGARDYETLFAIATFEKHEEMS